LVGLTLPFRRWFDARCDEVFVCVVKETSAARSTPTGSTPWIAGSAWARSVLPSWEEDVPDADPFADAMRRLNLYDDRNATEPIASVANATLQTNEGDA